MSYLVFARKYRPKQFSQILGQQPIVQTLTNAIEKKRIGQAYLFSGPRGTGKTSTARIFAKSLNCAKGPTATPCLKCTPCQEISEGRSMDILEIDGASNRGIDQIRALRDLAKLSPTAGQFKVYIIDEVHQITAEGFNALLKTLEEPPAHVLFILATTAPHKVPATILSRCQRYEFKRLALELISKKLESVAKEEKLQLDAEALTGIARAAQGSLRDAESILDQVAAYAGQKIKGKDVQTLLGAIDEEVFAQTLKAITEKDSVALLKIVAEAANAGVDLIQWGIDLLGFMRNLLVAKVGGGTLGFEEMDAQAAKELTELAQPFSIEALTAMAQELTGAVETMRRVGEPRIPLEVTLVRLATGGPMVSVAELVDRLEALQAQPVPSSQRVSPAKAAPVPPKAPPATPARPVSKGQTAKVTQTKADAKSAKMISAQEMALEQVIRLWPRLLDAIHHEKAATSAYLTEAAPVALIPGDPQELSIGLAKGFEFHRDALEQTKNRDVIQKVAAELLGAPVICSFKIVEELPELPEATPERELSAAADPEQSPQVPKEKKKPTDPSFLNSVAELFEGRVLPGER